MAIYYLKVYDWGQTLSLAASSIVKLEMKANAFRLTSRLVQGRHRKRMTSWPCSSQRTLGVMCTCPKVSPSSASHPWRGRRPWCSSAPNQKQNIFRIFLIFLLRRRHAIREMAFPVPGRRCFRPPRRRLRDNLNSGLCSASPPAVSSKVQPKLKQQRRINHPSSIHGQSYKTSTIVISESRVVPDKKLPILWL